MGKTYLQVKASEGAARLLGLDLLRDAGVDMGWKSALMDQIQAAAARAYKAALMDTSIRILGHLDGSMTMDQEGRIWKGVNRVETQEEADVIRAAAGIIEDDWQADLRIWRKSSLQQTEHDVENAAADLRMFYGGGA